MALTFKDIAEILKMIDASQCEEVSIEIEGLRLMVRRGGPHSGRPDPFSSLRSDSAAAIPGERTHTPGAAKRSGRTHAELSVAEGRVGVRAPMVGKFYRRPSPEEKAFAEVGQRVKAGDPLCLIEVMKLYTTIPSPADGVVEAIAIEDASAVEFDQLLFVIKPAGGG